MSAIILWWSTADAWLLSSSPGGGRLVQNKQSFRSHYYYYPPIARRIQTITFSSDASSESSSSTEGAAAAAVNVTATDLVNTTATTTVNGSNRQEQQQQLPQDNIEYAIPDGELWDKRNNNRAVNQVLAEMNESEAVDVVVAAAAPQEESAIETETESTSVASSILSDTIRSLTQPRSYPLFLAEKAAEFVEASLSKSFAATTAAAATSAPFGLSFNNNAAGGIIQENVVILGSGWGSLSFLQYINAGTQQTYYNVTILSPRDHFCFTPLLAGASVGTVDLRSTCEPITSINRQAHYIPAISTNIDPNRKIVTYENVQTGTIDEIEYDRLIVSVGAGSNTFGVPGVQNNCLFLRQVEDARTIKRAIHNAFRLAAAAAAAKENQDNDDINQQLQTMLTFAIVGAGPTGIELAAELKDFLQQDAVRLYGAELVQHARIKIIQASKTVLAQFDPELQKEAVLQMNVQGRGSRSNIIFPERLVELILESSVTKVNEDTIELDGGEVRIPYGVAVWAAGNGPLPITMQLIESLGPEQQALQDKARGRLAIDPWMRVVGSSGSILAVGDCSCITQDPLPATAQVASQQGEYLANLMNRKFELNPPSPEGEENVLPPPKRDPARTEVTLSDVIASVALNNSEYAKPFQFLNLGILAYTGNGSALAQVTPTPDSEPIKGTGAIGNVVWRGLYWSKQVSWRNRFLVLSNWVNTDLFGRNVDKL